jgi:DinB superfamily
VTSVQEFLGRLDAVTERLDILATTEPPGGLTEPDQPSGEQWEWGQVWAHIGEFPKYWLDQIDAVLASPGAGPIPFGRTKADPERIAAVERERRTSPADILASIRPELGRLRSDIEGYRPGDWSRPFLHSTLGEMSLERVLGEFLVGHLEQHADQLEGLVRQASR